MPNALTEPSFAQNPPVKLNVNARTLGLVYLILGIIFLIFALLGLIAVFGFCGSLIGGLGCGFPIIWLLGAIVGIASLVLFTVGAYRMYQLNRQGKEWVTYGLLLAAVGQIIGVIGNIVAYAGLTGYGIGVGSIVVAIIWIIIYFILYYLTIISRFPGEAPLVAPGGGYGSGGYGGGGYGSGPGAPGGGYGGSAPPPPPPGPAV